MIMRSFHIDFVLKMVKKVKKPSRSTGGKSKSDVEHSSDNAVWEEQNRLAPGKKVKTTKYQRYG